jgi:hypothetical protein
MGTWDARVITWRAGMVWPGAPDESARDGRARAEGRALSSRDIMAASLLALCCVGRSSGHDSAAAHAGYMYDTPRNIRIFFLNLYGSWQANSSIFTAGAFGCLVEEGQFRVHTPHAC